MQPSELVTNTNLALCQLMIRQYILGYMDSTTSTGMICSKDAVIGYQLPNGRMDLPVFNCECLNISYIFSRLHRAEKLITKRLGKLQIQFQIRCASLNISEASTQLYSLRSKIDDSTLY